MKVLFTNPPWWDGLEWYKGLIPVFRVGIRAGSRWPFTFQSLSFPGWRMPYEYTPLPIFMACAAGYVKQRLNCEVVVRDSIARRETYRRYWNFIAREQFDYIFIESATPSWEHDKGIIVRLHELSPRSKIVLCGPISATNAKERLNQLPVSACIKGEYEKGALQVLEGQTGVVDYNFLTEEEMNKAPWPLYDETTATSYYDRNPRGMRRPHAQVWSSRGCPFKCIFCLWPATMTGNDPDGQGKRLVRYYHAEYLLPFLTHLKERYRYRSVYFDDDTFNLGDDHTIEVCGVMKALGMPWSAMCRTDTIRMETWEIMRKSGCYGVKLGFESGNQYVVDHIVNKHLDLKHAREIVFNLKRLGLSVHGTFTIGLPGETTEQMRETMAFARSLPFDSIQLGGCAEIEGTPLHTLRHSGPLKAYKGAIINEDYSIRSDGRKKSEALIDELSRSKRV